MPQPLVENAILAVLLVLRVVEVHARKLLPYEAAQYHADLVHRKQGRHVPSEIDAIGKPYDERAERPDTIPEKKPRHLQSICEHRERSNSDAMDEHAPVAVKSKVRDPWEAQSAAEYDIERLIRDVFWLGAVHDIVMILLNALLDNREVYHGALCNVLIE